MKQKFFLSAPGVATAQGCTRATLSEHLLHGAPLPLTMVQESSRQVPAGIVHEQLSKITTGAFDTRCNMLAELALRQLSEEISAVKKTISPDRIGIVIGNSNSGVRETEESINAHSEKIEWAKLELGGPAEFISDMLDISGPAYVVSTACSSAAKAFGAAKRLLACEICDAVIVGGCDSFCNFIQGGFASLGLISAEQSHPFSAERNGINIGEGAAFFIMTKDILDVPAAESIGILGVGESSDAYHLTSPSPDGAGAESSMRRALADAGLATSDIDYINLHGTGTPANDAMEATAVAHVFGEKTVPASSSKPFFGHTLGASGAIEAALCWLTLSEKYNPQKHLPFHIRLDAEDASIPVPALVRPGESFPRINAILSNSFAFGGSNATVIIGKI